MVLFMAKLLDNISSNYNSSVPANQFNMVNRSSYYFCNLCQRSCQQQWYFTCYCLYCLYVHDQHRSGNLIC